MPGNKKKAQRRRRKRNQKQANDVAFVASKSAAARQQASAAERVKQDEARRFRTALKSSAETLQEVTDLTALCQSLESNVLRPSKGKDKFASLTACVEGVNLCFKMNPDEKNTDFDLSDEDFLKKCEKGDIYIDDRVRHNPAAVASYKVYRSLLSIPPAQLVTLFCQMPS